jgi:hypothetical protein
VSFIKEKDPVIVEPQDYGYYVIHANCKQRASDKVVTSIKKVGAWLLVDDWEHYLLLDDGRTSNKKDPSEIIKMLIGNEQH